MPIAGLICVSTGTMMQQQDSIAQPPIAAAPVFHRVRRCVSPPLAPLLPPNPSLFSGLVQNEIRLIFNREGVSQVVQKTSTARQQTLPIHPHPCPLIPRLYCDCRNSKFIVTVELCGCAWVVTLSRILLEAAKTNRNRCRE